jgi:thioredoxin-dependent peroxiredoxin
MLNVGDRAPEFSLPSDSGSKVSLSDFAGKTVVLYFFPKADTPG